jgi:peptidoglycan/LPS O-acetylase OafA/YrhL
MSDAASAGRWAKPIEYGRQNAKQFCIIGSYRLGAVRMDFYVIWPYIAVTIVIGLFASSPLLRSADLPPTTVPARVQTIDGLRGFLALGVFFHHSSIYHHYLLNGDWAQPPSRFYANLGHSGVIMFFMITGYLFWAQMLKARGRPNLLRLYIGRVFRILPLYFLLAFVVLLSVGVHSGWQLGEPPIALAKHVTRWLAGGVVTGGDVNGYATVGISTGVTWTLRYEWRFYASLLITSLFARQIIVGALLPVAGLLIAVPLLLYFQPQGLGLARAMMFCVGMTAASAKHTLVVGPLKTPQWVMSTAVVGCLALVLLGFDDVNRLLPIILLGLAFWLVVYGATVFGLLLTRSAKRLGDVSYGIYLLQGPVLFLSFGSSFVRSFATTSPWGHWAIVLLAAVALVMLATLTHSLIERPGIAAGRWVCSRFESSRHELSVWRTYGQPRDT